MFSELQSPVLHSAIFLLLILRNRDLLAHIMVNISNGLEQPASLTKSFTLWRRERRFYLNLRDQGQQPCGLWLGDDPPEATSLPHWGRPSEQKPCLYTWNKPLSALSPAGSPAWFVRKEATPCWLEWEAQESSLLQDLQLTYAVTNVCRLNWAGGIIMTVFMKTWGSCTNWLV